MSAYRISYFAWFFQLKTVTARDVVMTEKGGFFERGGGAAGRAAGRAVDRTVAKTFENDCEGSWDSHSISFFGCFPIRMSYLISAPLHSKFVEPFWTNANYIGMMAAFADLMWHLLLWIAVLIMDVWVAHIPNRPSDAHSIGDAFARELQWAATMSTGLVWAGLFLALVFGFLGQTIGGAWPSTISLIKGGGTASAIFSALYLLKMIAMVGDGDATTDDDWNTIVALPYLTIRQLTIWSLALKCLALAVVDANMQFGGPADREDIMQVCNLVQKGTKYTYKKAPKPPDGVPIWPS